MRTIELSNEKARTLAEILAKQWASLAIRLEASTAEVNTPFRCMGESSTHPAFKRRVASARREAKAIGEFLTALGADLPRVSRAEITVPYKRPIVKGHSIVGYKRGTLEMFASGPRREAEHKRLVAAVLSTIS